MRFISAGSAVLAREQERAGGVGEPKRITSETERRILYEAAMDPDADSVRDGPVLRKRAGTRRGGIEYRRVVCLLHEGE